MRAITRLTENLGFVFASWMLMPILLSFLLIYIFGHLDARTGLREKQLGMKVVLGLLMSIGFQAVLIGMSLWVVDAAAGQSSDLEQSAWALFVGGAILLGYGSHFFQEIGGVSGSRVLRRTGGVNAILTSLFFAGSLFGFLRLLFAGEAVGVLLFTTALYGSANSLLLKRL